MVSIHLNSLYLFKLAPFVGAFICDVAYRYVSQISHLYFTVYE